MTRQLTITYDKSDDGISVMCVAENNLFSMTVLKMFTGDKAESMFKELTGQNDNIKVRRDDND